MKRVMASETPKLVGQEARVCGWVNARRDHGKIIFIDLRDRSGIVQLVFDPGSVSFDPGSLRPEEVVEVTGLVKNRPKEMVNPKISTGEVEVEAKKIKILAKSAELPFPTDTNGYQIDEELRLKYRYLDLRRPRLVGNLELRHKVIKFIRDWLDSRGFIEVETPILTKATPEGARDFLVPSRLKPGKFYALPQSPQQYKQLLMVAGLEKYYQIARCFRDEDPRADRAYGEFTQLDLEMSFASQEDILSLTENLFKDLTESVLDLRVYKFPFPRISYKEAMEKFGTDKPDLREKKNDKNSLAFCFIVDFPLFEWKKTENRWDSMHHPFTAPKEEDIPLLEKDPGKVHSYQHDLVLNGFEVGGGSIRITSPQLQEKIFEILGHTKEEIKKKFGHLLKAFEYGVPPHGGIAPGIDRFLKVVLDEPSLREVIAFPMTAGGQTSVMEAPTEIAEEQLKELGISVSSSLRSADRRRSNLFDKIISLLNSYKIQYKVFEHRAVFTSEEAAEIRGTKLSQGAKALIMFGDKMPLMIVLPADRKIDFKKFKSATGIKNLEMATADKVKALAGVEIGAVPPFGDLLNLPLYVDSHLKEEEEIIFNAGLHTKSIQMRYRDFEKIAKPIIGDYT